MGTQRLARVLIFASLAALTGFINAACMDVGDDDKRAPFCVYSTLPEEGATDVSVKFPAVVITFECDVNPATITKDTFTVRDSSGALLEGDVWAAEKGVTAEFRLPNDVDFSPHTTYTVKISGNIQDIYGRSLAECEGGDYEFTFTTSDAESD